MPSKYLHLQQFLAHLKEPTYRYTQLLQSIFQQNIGNFAAMKLLPKFVRKMLIHEYGEHILNLQVLKTQRAKQIEKVLFTTPEGTLLEAMHLQYKKSWSSFCISSQEGCGYACSFCATGKLGFKKNLTPDEITDQLLYFLLQGQRIDSVSFMGMGEPLANPFLFETLKLLTHPQLFGLSQRRITISTVGIIPTLYELTTSFPQVHLTFSLHSPFPDQRSELMPVNQIFPLYEVLKALDDHILKTGKRVYLAYVLLQDVNDSLLHAQEIIKLVKSRKIPGLYHLDIIPYNSNEAEGNAYLSSNAKQLRAFVNCIKKSGLSITVRTQFGTDIAAGCGQLRGKIDLDGI